ncbi:hypothetical protein GCM10019016_101570 [Streptomyces prasinosporus]|uniref:Uncharacterized protein n=1 Tax=Streptomyces prasinosporus TaxID=68256 RepID=A0ABP6U5S6_9ACTN|nr:hypothetical protein GCM10010332_16100 [Streptomyces albogriseolus]
MQSPPKPRPGIRFICTPDKLIQFRHGAPNVGTSFTPFGACTHVLTYNATDAARTKELQPSSKISHWATVAEQ